MDAPPHRFPCFSAAPGSAASAAAAGTPAGAVSGVFPFAPDYHVHYTSRVVGSVADGTPKFADLPAEAGGTGAMVAE